MVPTEKILFIDIETFPILGYAWGTYEQNLLEVVEPTSICCFSAKWRNGKQITKGLLDYKGYKKGSRDDRKLVDELWDLLDDAEIVVAQNGDAFDIKKINARFSIHGLTPPSPYRTVDTLKIARSVFAFDSNKLNELGRYLGVGEKLKTGGFDLWKGCMKGDAESWKLMKQYNAQDVILLENVYKQLLPWSKRHPNMALGFGPFVCPKCGSTRLQARGFSRNSTTMYQRYQCLQCFGWSQDSTNLVAKEERPFKVAA